MLGFGNFGAECINDFIIYAAFKYCGHDWKEENGSVVGGVRRVTFFMYWDYICLIPLLGDSALS